MLLLFILQINYGKVGERGDQSPLQLELPAHHMEYVFSLLLATRYYFSVAAMNDHGRGPFSEQSEISTNSTSESCIALSVRLCVCLCVCVCVSVWSVTVSIVCLSVCVCLSLLSTCKHLTYIVKCEVHNFYDNNIKYQYLLFI